MSGTFIVREITGFKGSLLVFMVGTRPEIHHTSLAILSIVRRSKAEFERRLNNISNSEFQKSF